MCSRWVGGSPVPPHTLQAGEGPVSALAGLSALLPSVLPSPCPTPTVGRMTARVMWMSGFQSNAGGTTHTRRRFLGIEGSSSFSRQFWLLSPQSTHEMCRGHGLVRVLLLIRACWGWGGQAGHWSPAQLSPDLQPGLGGRLCVTAVPRAEGGHPRSREGTAGCRSIGTPGSQCFRGHFSIKLIFAINRRV
uniref:Uncharacterized protein n=1 Tax=Molossus molossus TaxID=27622 RepID=A0A7J8BJQ1_MOLMO|nr:hypothetical protein HJG59_010202 [Molossus molossus]